MVTGEHSGICWLYVACLTDDDIDRLSHLLDVYPLTIEAIKMLEA